LPAGSVVPTLSVLVPAERFLKVVLPLAQGNTSSSIRHV
jgi:hypothetical protein